MFDRILVPVDLTPKNRRAVETAMELAANMGGEVVVLHVIETLDLPWEEMERFYERLERRAHSRMEEICEPLRRADVSFRTEVTFGKRAETVVSYAEKYGLDLIVLSSHRVDLQNPAGDWTTLSYKVAILSQCPILLVK